MSDVVILWEDGEPVVGDLLTLELFGCDPEYQLATYTLRLFDGREVEAHTIGNHITAMFPVGATEDDD